MIEKIPKHLGIIINGNRRWAKKRGLPAYRGHIEGRKKVKDLCRWCKKRGIKIITAYTFSTENWKRSTKEVEFLMGLIERALKEDLYEIHRQNYKIRIIGQKEKLPSSLQKVIKEAEELTKNNTEGILNLAISYGGRAEIVEAIKNILRQGNSLEEITEILINQNLWTTDLPDPDLIIRTGNEKRLSGFLLWQAAYSELYFSEKLWPEFTEADLDKILQDYGSRGRRFGK